MWTISVTNFFCLFLFSTRNFKPGNKLIDLFSDHFPLHFHSSNTKKHIEKLDEIMLRALSNPFLKIIVSDTSIKNYITTLILHIHSYNKPVIKTIHRAINVTTTEAELFCDMLWNKLSSCQLQCQSYSDHHQLPLCCQKDIQLFSSSISNLLGYDISGTWGIFFKGFS